MFEVKSRPVAVVGNINLDIKTSVLAASQQIFADGETSVAEIYESLGGGAANTALAGAMLGGEIHLCACTGRDELGERLEAAARRFGIIPHFARKNVPTGRSINLNWENSNRHFVSSLPNTRALTADDVDVGALADAQCCHLFRADIWFSESMLDDGNAEVFKQAGDAGMETSMDINFDPEWLAEESKDRIRARKESIANVLPLVDWVHGNDHELMVFTGCEDIESACRSLTSLGAAHVIVHLGSRGCAHYCERDGMVAWPAVPVESPVCQTGTGDVFTAAFLLSSSLPLDERLRKCGEVAAAHLSGKPSLIPRL